MAIDVKGLVYEYILIIVLYALDLGTEFGCFSEVQYSRTRYQMRLLPEASYRYNYTRGFGVCKTSDWDREEYEKKIKTYGALADTYLFLLIFASIIFVCYMSAYLWFVLRAWHRAQYIAENREHIIHVKFIFGFLLSFALDIPGSCMACVLYAMRYGTRGLHCWDCAQDAECVKKQELEHRIYISQVAIVPLLFILIIVSLWKGVTTFYRWSKTDKVDCWHIRGCVALFVGMYYVVIILTPGLGIFKYMLFRLPSESENVFAEFTNSLFLIGMLGWIIFIVVGCCFPLLRCIRTPSAILKGNGENA